MSAKVDIITKVGMQWRCDFLPYYCRHLFIGALCYMVWNLLFIIPLIFPYFLIVITT